MTHSRIRCRALWAAVAGLPLTLGCPQTAELADSGQQDSGSGDAGGTADSGTSDAGLSDAGPTPDSGQNADAGAGDAGSLESIGIVTSCTLPGIPDAGYALATNVLYATMNGETEDLDIAWPTDGGTHPLVVFIHGGGWVAGDKMQARAVILELAGLGYAAASLNYRLIQASCPVDGGIGPDGGFCYRDSFPAAVEDVRCAVRWLRQHAVNYEVDPSRVASMGGSAGGHLAAMLGTAANAPGLDGPCPLTGDVSVKGAVPYYGPEDLEHWEPSYASAAAVAMFLDTAKYNTDPPLARRASPIDWVDGQSPPFLMLHGTADQTVPYEQSPWMKAALNDAGVPATVVTLPDAGHGFPIFSAQPEYVTSSCTTLAFLKATLNP